MEKNERLNYLLDCCVKNTDTPEERNELLQMLQSHAYNEQVKDFMSRSWDNLPYEYPISDEQSRRILSSILLQNKETARYMHIDFIKRHAFWAAASVLFLMAFGYVFYLHQNSAKQQQVMAAASHRNRMGNDVSPGTTGAILTLADGSSITLDSALDGGLARQGSVTILKKGGQVNYIKAGSRLAPDTSYNTITTPRGRQYQLVLEDGTHVWLNTASSIRFPAVFNGKTREVSVTGEAYFEVAKNPNQPFHVTVSGTVIEVLGTHFNVNAYSDEAAISTTLLEGAVKVKRGGAEKILSPGQQAQVTDKGELNIVKKVNTEEVVSWKNNYFSFNNTDIRNLMRQLARWYNLEVVFNEDISHITLYGNISRAVNLSSVLKMLEYTEEVKFSIEGTKVYISKGSAANH